MITFKEFIKKAQIAANRLGLRQSMADANQICLDEHHVYRRFPGEKTSYRIDSGNTSTLTQRHAHVYAQPEGKGRQLYAVNIDGSGHDGSSGTEISSSHADFLRGQGFDIPTTNIIEQLDHASLGNSYRLILIE
jgi:hypothetical protein